MKMKSLILTAIFFAAGFSSTISAQQSTTRSADQKNEVSLTASTRPELQAKYLRLITIPHNVELRAGASLTPVSINALCDTIWTPLPFAQLVASASAGTGWNTPAADGLRANRREGAHGSRLSGGNFNGAVCSAGPGGALQFDYAAIVPGKWNHIVARSYHTVYYRALTSASSGESWLYEADDGENRNGLNYYGNLFVGYKMPLMLNLAGFLIEADRYLYNEKQGEDWGDDLVRWTLSPMAGAQFTEELTGTVLVQFRSRRNFTGRTGDYGFYQERILDKDDPQHFEFFRAAAALTYSFY